MNIEVGKFIKEATEFDNKHIICTVKDFNRDKYLNYRVLIRTIIILPISFYIGYISYYSASDLKSLLYSLILYCCSFVLAFYIAQLPYELLRSVFYPNFFSNKDIKLIFFNRQRLVTAIYTGEIHIFRLILSLIIPLIVLLLIPITLINYLGGNYILYGCSTSILILASDDILNLLLLLKNTDSTKSMNIISNSYEVQE